MTEVASLEKDRPGTRFYTDGAAAYVVKILFWLATDEVVEFGASWAALVMAFLYM